MQSKAFADPKDEPDTNSPPSTPSTTWLKNVSTTDIIDLFVIPSKSTLIDKQYVCFLLSKT